MLGKTVQEKKWATEDEIIRWHQRLNGHGFEQTQGDGEGLRRLVGGSPWCQKESDKT